jgi:hypothetical protein
VPPPTAAPAPEPARAPPASPVGVAATTPADEGQSVAYRELERHLGSRVQVRTIYGTTRRGRLAAYASMMISLKLDPEEGGFALAIPQYSVADVQLLGEPQASTAGGANAQTN